MEYLLIIPGKLPGLNEYVTAERTSRYMGAKTRRNSEDFVAIGIKQQLKGLKINNPVELHYTWIEPDMRRDRDNIAFAKKFIQDALVNCGVLKDDGWKYIVRFSDSFAVDKENPRIEVKIKEVN